MVQREPSSERRGLVFGGDMIDNRKQSLYFPEEMLKEIKEESIRLDRSLSWIVQRAWMLAREQIKAAPAHHLQKVK